MSTDRLSKTIAHVFRDIYGQHNLGSGVVKYLVERAYYEIVKMVKILRPDLINSFAKRETITEDCPFEDEDWVEFIADVFEITRIMYAGFVLDRIDPDRIDYLNSNEDSIFGGELTPKYSILNYDTMDIIFYPERLKEVEGTSSQPWRIYYVPKTISVGVNDTTIDYSPSSLFVAIIKYAVIITLNRDLMERRRKFLQDLEEQRDELDDSIDTLITHMTSLTEETAEISLEGAEYTAIRTLVADVNTALTNLTTYLNDEDAEMVEASARKIQSIIEKIRAEVQILSEKWGAFVGIRGVASQAAIGTLNAIANLTASIQGTAIAFVEGTKQIDGRKLELIEEIKADISGA